MDDEGNIQCVEHKDFYESGIGNGKHVRWDESCQLENRNQESYMSGNSGGESDLGEEKDNPPEYLMCLAQKADLSGTGKLSAVLELSGDHSEGESTGRCRHSRGQTVGTYIIEQEMSSNGEISDAQDLELGDSKDHAGLMGIDSMPRGSIIRGDFCMGNPFLVDRKNTENSRNFIGTGVEI